MCVCCVGEYDEGGRDREREEGGKRQRREGKKEKVFALFKPTCSNLYGIICTFSHLAGNMVLQIISSATYSFTVTSYRL